MTAHLPRVLLLDLGRGPFDMDFDRCLGHWAEAAGGRAPELRVRSEHLAREPAIAARERGELKCEAFFAGLAALLGLDLSTDTLRDDWNGIFGPDIPGLRDRLEALAEHCDLHVLGNTNATHAEHFRVRHAGLLGAVDRIFTSHELGMRKPEARIHDHVLMELDADADADAGDVLFLDDDLSNLAAAARGLRTRHVAGPERTCAVLDDILAGVRGMDR